MTPSGRAANTKTAAAKAMLSLRPSSDGEGRAGRARTPGTKSTIAAASRRYAGNAGIRMRKKLASSMEAGM